MKAMSDDQLMSPQDLADYLQVPLATVYKWNATGQAPRARRVGRHTRYTRADVEKWLEARAS